MLKACAACLDGKHACAHTQFEPTMMVLQIAGGVRPYVGFAVSRPHLWLSLSLSFALFVFYALQIIWRANSKSILLSVADDLPRARPKFDPIRSDPVAVSPPD